MKSNNNIWWVITMKKQLLLIGLVGLLSACNGGYKVYKEVHIGANVYYTSVSSMYKVAKYTMTTNCASSSGDCFNVETFYLVYSYQEDAKEVPEFTEEASLGGVSNNGDRYPLKLAYKIGIYKTYSQASYNESKKKLKYIESHYEKVKLFIRSDEELNEAHYYYATTDGNGYTTLLTSIFGDNIFKKSKQTSYIIVGSEDTIKLVPMDKSK